MDTKEINLKNKRSFTEESDVDNFSFSIKVESYKCLLQTVLKTFVK